ncbi:MAG: GAF domain-containing sensor histidine kinase [Acidobacteriota bacterium]|nr:GAF domain-containing sensor histidine kinase [Acidobacteriota bacterium]
MKKLADGIEDSTNLKMVSRISGVENFTGHPPSTTTTTSAAFVAGDLHDLSAEVVDILYTQAFSGAEMTEAGICEAFANVLLRHWSLCGIIVHLRGDDEQITESFIYTQARCDEAKSRRIGALLAASVGRTHAEQLIWLSEENKASALNSTKGIGEAKDGEHAEVRAALEDAGFRAGVGVPIRARGKLVGVLVAVSSEAERLRVALRGVRFIAAPIVIAIGNARRAHAMNNQRHHIERLVEKLQQRSAALEEANIELQRVGRYRSLFLARMSHELRTPLTSILGFAEILLEQEDLTDAQRRFCDRIQSSGKQLHASLNQLVDLSRLEAGHAELFLHEFSLREMLRESCAAVGRLAQKQDIKIECCTAPELATIVSDEGKLRQVVYNFFAHAISRSPAGSRVVIRAEPAPSGRFSITVIDDGDPLGDSLHLFDPVDLDANEHGTNMNELGLIIAHRLIGVLGGTVTLETDAPRGLTVRLEFPMCPTE